MNFIRLVQFDIKNILRNPMLLFMNTLFPVLMIGIMGLVTAKSFGAGFVSSFDYNGVAMMIFTAVLISGTATNTFMEETVKKGNLRIVYAPIPKTQIYLSKLVSTFLLGSISYSVILMIGQFLFHLKLGGSNIGYIILLINLFAWFSCSLGIMCCCLFKSEEGANSIVPLIVLFFVFFGGVFFPVASLGKVVETISVLSPVRWVSECAFQIIYDQNFTLYLPVILLILATSIIFIVICEFTFKPEELI